MNCKAARELFSVAFDGELSVSEEREFESHLGGCSFCSREFDIFVKSMKLVSSLPRPSTSPLFEQKVIHALNADESAARPPEPRVPLLTPRPAFAFATALILVVLVMVWPGAHSEWENDAVSRQLANSQLAMSELASARLDVIETGDAEVRSLVAPRVDDALVSSSEMQLVSGDERSLWSGDARFASAAREGDAASLLSDLISGSGAVYEIEFVLDPFLFEGAEVRRLDTRPISVPEMELVSMTF